MATTNPAVLARRISFVAIIACASAFTPACADFDDLRGDAAVVAAGTASTSAGTAGSIDESAAALAPDAIAPPTYLGALPKSRTYMSAHPEEFVQFVSNASLWKTDGISHPRYCEESACTETVNAMMQLDVISDAHTVNFRTLPPNGVLMAQMTNLSSYTELTYHVPPGKGHVYVYWNGPASSPKVRIVRLTYGANGKPTVRFEGEHALALCPSSVALPHKHGAEAGYWGCDQKPPGSSASLLQSKSKNVWVSCSLGCCSSDYPPLMKLRKHY